MLGSFGSSSHEEEEDPSPPDVQCSHHHHRNFPSPAIQMRQLLISCAELISRSDFSSAHKLITFLSSNSSPYGDSTERLAHQLTKSLSLRLNRYSTALAGMSNLPSFLITNNPNIPSSSNNASSNLSFSSDNETLLQSSYLTLNQITPFVRFSQLTANQAILDSIEEGQQSIHIIDFDIMHGVQWPPFMSGIMNRFPLPSLRITGAGNDLNTLRRTGDRLAKFAHSLGLRFQFHPLLLSDNDDLASAVSSVIILPDETLAVNCVLNLHKLLKDRERLHLFLQRVKSMNPKVVTLAEIEANHNHPLFFQRFVEAIDYYAAVFDSLEATLPPNSKERLNVEQVWFGREILDIVAAEGDSRRERHEKFRSWEMMLRSKGFNVLPLSPFALSQAKLLLRLHYPSEGYQLHVSSNSLFLGWQNKPLFSISSWR
ncbi:hypothetical protein Leryth_014375 [Lithospermum erythrorhizon]|uniref:Scarecrow-like protein 18 n=1 Tax=Lithospermum erythrorhizon TaxID=34254 RepID=A0AAV3QZV2_LITER|nr:hypothetical protein Leryth_014375 [Lithospermum erythrorhizon]